MSRIQADLVLLLVALIWGAAFVAQKNALAHVGSFTFIAARFAISGLLVLPLALRERSKSKDISINRTHAFDLALLCVSFAGAVVLQQVGLEKTSVTNAGFLTGLYVLFVPVICRVIYKQTLSILIYPAALLSIAGVFFLSGGELTAVSPGDGLVLLCAVGFAIQVALIGKIMAAVKAPFRICLLQYASCALVALIAALAFEHPTLENIMKAALPILYAGAISGGIAYTLQVVAQQYTPASDSAVILSGESVFAALTAAVMKGERLTPTGASGCMLIILAILMVQFGPYMLAKRKS
ncbi:MAG: DMT family transporter [Alphaproteobacteria bacterium]|nr:MAG: DMT family transporter [Alphaproteobacteria bacterium]